MADPKQQKPGYETTEDKPIPVFPPVGTQSRTRKKAIHQLFQPFKRLPRELVPPTTKEEEKDKVNVVEDQREESLSKMYAITHKRANILFKARTTFPLDLFPDELTVLSTKIEIKQYHFFNTYTTITIPLQDIGYVDLQTVPFFATLVIFNIRSQKAYYLRYLHKGDAIKGKKIINGLLIAQESGVDVSVVEPKRLLPQLEGLGA